VLHVIWADDGAPMFVAFIPGAWNLILRRAIAMQPQNNLPV
jgi:hypothetical protein